MYDFISEKSIDETDQVRLSRLTIPRIGGTAEYHALQYQEYEKVIISEYGIMPTTAQKIPCAQKALFSICLSATLLLILLLVAFSNRVFQPPLGSACGAIWIIGIVVSLFLISWCITAGASMWSVARVGNRRHMSSDSRGHLIIHE